MVRFYKNKIFQITFALLISGVVFSVEWNPTADPKAVVVSEDVRITVLTPRLLRLEWAENGQFEDHASLTFVNRRTEVPPYKKTQKGSLLVIETEGLTLWYNVKSGRFTKDNLSIDVNTGGMKTTWHFGDPDDQNLLGTTRTLDKCNANWHATEKKEIALEKGIISRSGWSGPG